MPEPLLPIASWINTAAEPALAHAAPAFEAFGDAAGALVEGLQAGLLWLHPAAQVVLLAALGWWRRGWRLSLLAGAALAAIHAMGFGEPLAATLAQMLVATLVSIALGVPLGIWLGGSPRAQWLARPLLDLMQTMPAFVYLIPAVALFGLGLAPALLATVVFALPPVVRLTALGIRQVGRDVTEAAASLGARDGQVLRLVRLPYALPGIMAGVSQGIMMALSMTIIASMVGAGGLGSEVLASIQRLDIGQGAASGLSVVLLAMVVDRLAESFAPPESTPPH
ncbi:ABC transporter permease [Xylophilus sp.]|uniref:ABC transporter permease n=1 Tax=Xylophilus sp. TaxID=2653893 RepID=UPI0013B853DA|nr:ABC transporter permease subunit [Xylophilus sp.]KAF1046751.1 MAG: Glycine betaine transport system permease protein OpuAB [Xylophilus sp.]